MLASSSNWEGLIGCQRKPSVNGVGSSRGSLLASDSLAPATYQRLRDDPRSLMGTVFQWV